MKKCLVWIILAILVLSACEGVDETTLRNLADQQYIREYGQLPEEALIQASIPDWVRPYEVCRTDLPANAYMVCWEPMAGALDYILVERYPTEAAAQEAFDQTACDEWLELRGHIMCHSYTYHDASEPAMYGHYRITSVIAWQDQHRIFRVQREYHSTIPTGEFDAMSFSEQVYENALELGLIIE